MRREFDSCPVGVGGEAGAETDGWGHCAQVSGCIASNPKRDVTHGAWTFVLLFPSMPYAVAGRRGGRVGVCGGGSVVCDRAAYPRGGGRALVRMVPVPAGNSGARVSYGMDVGVGEIG